MVMQKKVKGVNDSRISEKKEKKSKVKKERPSTHREAPSKFRFRPHMPGGIRTKLILSFLTSVIFIVILGWSAYSISARAITNSFSSSTVSLIASTAQYYEIIAQNVRSKAVEIATDNSIYNYYNGNYSEDAATELTQGLAHLTEDEVFSDIKKKMTTTLALNTYISDITMFTDYGNAIATSSSFKDTSPYEAFKSAEEAASLSKDSWWGLHSYVDSQLGISSSKYALTYVKQFINDSGKKSGYLFVDINMKTITESLSSMALPDGSIAAFITADGREITAEGNSSEVLIFGTELYKKALEQEDSTWNTTTNYQGKKNLFICSKIGDTGAIVAALVPYASLASQANDIKGVSAVIILLAIILSTVIGILVASGISRNIRVMIQALSKAAKGDLTVSINTRRRDEFHTLFEGINHMITNMKHLITKASDIGETVISSSYNVSVNSDLLLAAARDISLAIGEIQKGIIQQASDAEECLRQTETLTSQISVVHENSSAIEGIAEKTKEVVTNGILEVKQLNNAAQANIGITLDTIRNIEDLETESKEINEIIAVINDIAEQTNLLSLNASIEAARAGAAGRGFSVVAEEIRKLSEKSVNSSQEIEKIVNKIFSKTQTSAKTVMKAGDISKTMEDRLIKVVELFDHINLMVDDLVTRMKHILDGINDIDSAKNDTLKAIESISAISEETSAASQEVDATAHQQLEAVTKMNGATKALSQDSQELKDAISLFKTN